jgi:hypothetical protein
VNQTDAHQLVISMVFGFAAVICVILFRTRARTTWFAPLVGVNCLLAGLVFGILALAGISSWRAEVLGSMIRELPLYFILSCISLAQAGWRPAWPGVVRAAIPECVARRPRLQGLLIAAPVVLLGSWLLLGAGQMVWPAPALQSFAPAPPRFFLFSLLTSLPIAFYTGLIAYVFVLAAGPKAPTRGLRLKNAFFATGVSAWFLLQVNATAHAAERVVLPTPLLHTTTSVHLAIETALLLTSAIAFAVGLASHYTPAIDAALVRQGWPSLLRFHERFESRRWQLVRGNKLKGLVRASYYASQAAHMLRIGSDDIERLNATIHLAAVFAQPSSLTVEVTPEWAKELLTQQTRIVEADSFASRLTWPKGLQYDTPELESIESMPLRAALGAALDFSHSAEVGVAARENSRTSWYCLAAVVSADFGYADPERIHADLGHRLSYHKALTAYTIAKESARSLTAGQK